MSNDTTPSQAEGDTEDERAERDATPAGDGDPQQDPGPQTPSQAEGDRDDTDV